MAQDIAVHRKMPTHCCFDVTAAAMHLDPRLLPTFAGTVPPEWGDYNAHMNEARYLEVFAQSNDRLMEIIGADAAYIRAGMSYFTLETHLRHLGEIAVGSALEVHTLFVAATDKTIHLFHYLVAGPECTLAATSEHILVHVDLSSRKSCPPAPELGVYIDKICREHEALPRPDALGKGIARRGNS